MCRHIVVFAKMRGIMTSDSNQTAATFVDVFAIPINRSQLDDYWPLAETAAGIWQEHGAAGYHECVLTDDNGPGTQSFAKMAGCADDETLVLAWVTYPSRAARDAANEKIMHDPRMGELYEKCQTVFSGERMGFGGFEQMISLAGA